MFDHCQPVLVNNLYGSLTINTNDSFSCIKPRQWFFFYDYGYKLFIRFINITQLLSNLFIFKIYSIINKQKTLIYDSTNATFVNNEIQFDVNEKNSGILFELMPLDHKNLQQTSFIIDYVFRTNSQSRYGRQILQDNSSSSSSFNASQPSFIALICIIAFLLVAIIIAITILCYRHYSHRKRSKNRHKIQNKFRQVLNDQQSNDQTHLASSITPSSTSSYSIRSSRHLCSDNHPTQIQQQNSSLGQSISTLPSMIPSRRLQQSIMDAYLNDFDSFQPTTIDPKQLKSYLFIDLHSTSSETFPDGVPKHYPNGNTTTSGYDTSTCGEDRNYKKSHRYRRRRFNHNQRQRRRSTQTLKRSNGPRFLMRERSLPNTLVKLPQLRQPNHLFDIRDHNNSSTTSNTNQDHISTNLSTTTDDYDDSHAYHVNSSRIMNTIEEEQPSIIHKSLPRQSYLFEMVSTYCGDDSDMPNYEDIPIPLKSSSITGDGIAYVNDSIIV
ncbi:unnamed protein product [Rotaria sp. Silwood1]|nr:unnamed protein product [Rotaria sp. Silwood1]CAF1000911.1 unnamed protein product [Rotaria sp. Silwood1]CAF3386551.1 unnamed protein product [Rotaria sp. Silwood1]CAF3411034.1 unnamed protein product [Rotaria sp. Silwood1]CAF4569469.1 unnamed protein product [Rotaria sp. Silwood1]